MSARFDRETSRIEVDHDYQPLRTSNVIQVEGSSDEQIKRNRARQLFNKYDIDRDGFIVRRELRRLIREHPAKCLDLPKGVSRSMLEHHDADGDDRLDFEEFYKLSQQQSWMLRDLCERYRNYIVPQKRIVVVEKELPQGFSGAVAFAAADTVDSDGTYEQQMSFCPPPITMIIISIVEVAFFVYDIVHLQEYKDKDINNMGLNVNGPAAKIFIYNPWRRYQAWRFVTYMFVHVGIMHITMNLLVQVFLGVALELVHCWWRVLAVYLSGVVAGSMGTSISNPNIYLAGASGGVYALITAHVATIIMNWKEMESGLVQLVVFLTYIVVDAAASYYRHVYEPNDRVGYTAHLSGAIAGLLVGLIFLKNLHVLPHERFIWWSALAIYSGLMIAGICFHIFNPEYFLKLGFP